MASEKTNVVKEHILTFLANGDWPDGKVAQEELLGALNQEHGVAALDALPAINELLKEFRIKLYPNPQKPKCYLYSLVDDETRQADAAVIRLNAEERLVYQTIEEGGRKGTWTRDIRSKAGLSTPRLNKILKTLENKRLIKPTKWPEQPRKRIYMLYQLREELGFFHHPETRELDTALIQTISDRCYRFIQESGVASLNEIWTHIRGMGSTYEEPKEEDIQLVLDLLLYDGLIEEVQDSRSESVLRNMLVAYKTSGLRVVQPNGYTDVPCSRCPVAHQCSDEGEVTPAKCVYFSQWLADAW